MTIYQNEIVLGHDKMMPGFNIIRLPFVRNFTNFCTKLECLLNRLEKFAGDKQSSSEITDKKAL